MSLRYIDVRITMYNTSGVLLPGRVTCWSGRGREAERSGAEWPRDTLRAVAAI